MSVIVEDGTGVANANSYGTDAGLLAYAAARGIELTSPTTALLVRACDWLETKTYMGNKANQYQALQWPRMPYAPVPVGVLGFPSFYNYPLFLIVDGYIVNRTDIPARLIKAQYEAAIAMDEGYDPNAIQDQQVIAESVGPIKVQYQPGSSAVPYMPVAEKTLQPLLAQSGLCTVGRG